jgi:chemotaxis signal transduction protein
MLPEMISVGAAEAESDSIESGLMSGARPACTVVLAGVPLCIAADTRLEFLDDLAVFPVPHASARLMGLAQSRGRIFPVFDPYLLPKTRQPARKLAAVLLETPDSLAACWVDEAPVLWQGHEAQAIHSAYQSAAAGSGNRSGVSSVFGSALGKSVVLAGQSYWTIDIRQMLDILASQGYST